LAISTQITAVFYAKFDNNIGFQEKKPVFAVIWQKSVKIVNISLTPVGILFKVYVLVRLFDLYHFFKLNF
jgi:hypothetical protein